MSAASPPVVRVFISCPGNLRPECGVVAATLAALEAEPTWRGRVQLVPYAYENIVPAPTPACCNRHYRKLKTQAHGAPMRCL
jgi:hypothetical protein